MHSNCIMNKVVLFIFAVDGIWEDLAAWSYCHRTCNVVVLVGTIRVYPELFQLYLDYSGLSWTILGLMVTIW